MSEELNVVVGVFLDDQEFRAGSVEIPRIARNMAEQTNAAISRVGEGGGPGLEKLAQGIRSGVVGLQELTVAASVAREQLALAAETTRSLASMGVGSRVVGIEEVQRLNAELNIQIEIRRQLAATGQVPGVSSVESPRGGGRNADAETGRLISNADVQERTRLAQQELDLALQQRDLLTSQITSTTILNQQIEKTVALEREATAASAPRLNGPLAAGRDPALVRTIAGAGPEQDAAELAASLQRLGGPLSATTAQVAALQKEIFGLAEAERAAASGAETLAQREDRARAQATEQAAQRAQTNAVIDPQAPLAGFSGANARQQAELAAAQLREEAAAASVLARQATEPEAAKGLREDAAASREQANAITTALTATVKESSVAFSGEGEAAARSNALLETLGQTQGRLRERTLQLVSAQESYNAVLANPERTIGQQASALSTLETRQRLLAEEQQRASAASEGGGGGRGGFFSGLTQGAAGGGGFGAGGIGQQIGELAKYVLAYDAFQKIATFVGDAVKETVNFEAEVTNLNFQLGTTRDQAEKVANGFGDIAAKGGLAPSVGVALATQEARAFQGQAPADQLGNIGAAVGTEFQALSGEKAQQGLTDTIAVVKGFNLGFADTQRVLDVATSAAQNFGFANANAVLPGLGQIGDVAKQAGFSLEQTANLIGLISQTNSENSTSAAGELRRVFGREGNQAFQSVFANFGVSTTQPFQQELEQLSKKFNTLSDSAKAFIVGQFGGGRAGTAALALLQEYSVLQANTNKTLGEGGLAQDEFNKRLQDLQGLLRTVGGDLKNLGKDIGESGIGAIFGAALVAADPLLKVLDQIVRLFNQIPSGIREVGFGGAELAGGIALASRIRGSGGAAAAGGTAAAEVEASGAELAASLAQVAATVSAEAALLETGSVEVGAAIDAIVLAFAGGTITSEAAIGALTLAIDNGAAGIIEAESLTVDALVTGSEEIAAASAEIALAMAATAEELAAIEVPFIGALNGLIDATVIASQRILGAATGAGGGGFLSGGALGIGVVAAVGAVLVNQAFSAAQKSTAADSKGTNDLIGIGGNQDLEALRKQAEQLQGDAKAISQANGGLFGSLVLGVQTLFQGGANSNTTKGEDRVASQRLLDQAQQIEALNKQAGTSTNTADLSGLIDLTKPGGAAAGLKTLADSGRDARTQIDTLIQAIKNLATTSGTAADTIGGPIAQATAARKTSNEIINQIAQDQSIRKEQSDTSGFLGIGKDGSAGRDSDILGKLGPDIQGQLNNDITTFLASGGKLDRQGKKQLESLLQADAQGYKDFGKLTQEAQKNVLADIVLGVQQLGNSISASKELDPATIRQAVGQSADAAIKLSTQAGQIAGVDQGLGRGLSRGVGSSDGQKQAADRATLENLNKARDAENALIKSGFSSIADPTARAEAIKSASTELEQLNNAIDAAQLAFNGDIVASLQVALALKNSRTPKEDKAALDQNTLGELQAALAAQTDPALKAQAQAAVNNQQGVVNRDALDTQAAQARSLVNPADVLGNQRDALNALKSKRDFFVSIGQTTDTAYLDLVRSIQAATQTLAVDTVKQANAVAEARIDPRNAVAVARQKLADDRRLLAALPEADVVGRAQAAAAVSNDAFAVTQAQVARANAQGAARVRAGDPTADAVEKLTEAQRTLRAADRSSDQYFTDLAAVNQAKLALASALAAQAKTNELLRGDTTDPLEQARASLIEVRRKQAEDLSRGVGSKSTDKLAVTNATEALQKAAFSQQFQDNQTAFNLREESAKQYLGFLEGQDKSLRRQLGAMKKGGEGYRQLVDELNQVDQAIQSASSQLQGQFNLGDIKLPTVYEVRRQVAANQNGQAITSNTISTINTTINGADFARVVAYVNSIIGPSANTVALAGRKA